MLGLVTWFYFVQRDASSFVMEAEEESGVLTCLPPATIWG